MAELGQLVDAIEERSDALNSLGYRVRFDLTDGGSILVDATGGKVDVSTVEGGEADTVMKLSSDNLLKLVQGKLNPMIAFSTGRLKVQGSQGVAMKLAGLLDG
ncbi:SCP2 sterol-binding domain-containing protein [Methylobacterium persicinum]|uniref:Sterol carrier protein n=1 Tax=Methylobacterium persicinum TaxID=374426 RepID=A0ABU0HPG8_9HYPH|nr:SCP2 sterol-binding domain-containing protein [Methylobacterium persicinum]MDQ0444219.1 putative sterol carrier protein [Methylobacterium persicinum]GJE39605.1 Ubiquinone biosynthesis accessory factor UbiJ [Methylobacterium persicinum]